MSMTQHEVDKAFEETRNEWVRMGNASGKQRALFLMTNEAVEFLYHFSLIRKHVLDAGLNIGELERGVTITEHD